MDRETVVISQSIIGFVDFFVYPLFEVLTDLVYPFGDFILDNLSNNKEYWISLNDEKQLVNNNEGTPPPESSKASWILTICTYLHYSFLITCRLHDLG